MFETIVHEVQEVLPERLIARYYERLGARKTHKLLEERKAELARLLAGMERLDLHVAAGEIQEAIAFFERNQRDLGAKDPIPDIGDLRIMIQASRLGGTVFVFSKDRHFTRYADLIRQRWGIEVVPVLDYYQILGNWGW